MPNQHDDSTQPAVQLPWESMDDDAEAPTPAADAHLMALAAAVEASSHQDGESQNDGTNADADLLDYATVSVDVDDGPGAVDYERPVPAEPVEDDLGPAPKSGGWTVALLCAGIAVIACCVIIPQADSNRRLAYERERLKVDVDSIRKQVATNDEFLARVADDPNLAERLAQRQMKIIREGTRVLELKKSGKASARGGAAIPDDVSPFHLVALAPPPPMPPYEPRGGRLATLCYNPSRRLYLMGAGLFMMAVGLVCGYAPEPGKRV